MSKYLYGLSVNGIQGYIFATNELKSIVGASEIVKSINKKVLEYGVEDENIIINAAGNIKLVFDEDKKDILEKLVREFPKDILQNGYGLELSQAVVKFDEGGLRDAFGKLEARLFTQRNKPKVAIERNISIIKHAPKTAKPAVAHEKNKATLQKEKMSNSSGNIPKNSKNKTAIIHADGNGLGAMIASMSEGVQSDEELVEVYRAFSKNLERATQNAFEIAKHKRENIRDVILGGDDMTIICEANIALDFTREFLEEFENETKRVMGNNGLTACAGIVYANHKYPFHYALSLAESLCSYSKKHSKDIDAKLPPSSVTFYNIQSSNTTDYREYIEKEMVLGSGNETVHLNYGPYFIKEQKEYATVSSFLNLCGALSQKGSPLSRLREWLTLLSQNPVAAKERLLRINEMMELKSDIYNKKILQRCLSYLDKEIQLEELTTSRGEKKYTPIGDVDSFLSAVDNNFFTSGDCKDEI